MNILILGGTGAMGVHLVDLLAEQGHQVTVTSRSKRPDKPGVRYVVGNAKEITFLHSVLSECIWDAIVDFMVYTLEEFRDRIQLLLQFSRQYVFLSSARVYADSLHPITENMSRLLDATSDSRFLAVEKYALAKAREENLLYAQTQHHNWTIVRPYITYNSHRLQLGSLEKEIWLFRALRGKPILFSKDIARCYTTLTHGKDVAAGIAGLLGKPGALGETFHITTQQSIRWEEVLQIYLNVLEEKTGKRPSVVWLEEALALKAKRARYQVLYDRRYNRFFDNSKIKSFCPDLQFTDVYAGLRASLEEFLRSPSFVRANLWLNAREDRYMKDFTPLAEISSPVSKLKYLLLRYCPYIAEKI